MYYILRSCYQQSRRVLSFDSNMRVNILRVTCWAPFLIFFECVFSLLFSLFPGVIMICIVSFYSNTRMQRKYQRIQIENVIRFTDNNNFVQKNKQCFGLRTIHNITFNAAKHCVRLSSNKQMKSIRIMRNFIMLKTNTRPPAIILNQFITSVGIKN